MALDVPPRLLSLPLELRQEIYIHLFSWSDKNIPENYLTQAKNRGLYCGVCRIGFRKDRYRGDKDGCPASVYRPQSSISRSLAILQTCVQLYHEATDVIYNKTLVLITNQHTSEPYSYQSSNWRHRTQWTPIGTVEDCRILRRMDNVLVEQYLPTGRAGLAIGPKLRLLGEFLKSLGPDRKSMEVMIRLETNQLHSEFRNVDKTMHQLWKGLADLLGQIEFGCRPRLLVEDSIWSIPRVSRDEVLSKWRETFQEMLEIAGVPYESLEVRTIP